MESNLSKAALCRVRPAARTCLEVGMKEERIGESFQRMGRHYWVTSYTTILGHLSSDSAQVREVCGLVV